MDICFFIRYELAQKVRLACSKIHQINRVLEKRNNGKSQFSKSMGAKAVLEEKEIDEVSNDNKRSLL